MTDTTQTDDAGRDRLLDAIAWLLRPLVRLFVRRAILLPAAVGLIKRVYVETVVDDLERRGETVTDSRISALTGVHRRDVKSLRQSGAPASAAPGLPVIATLIARWIGDPAFTDRDGRPLPLPRTAPSGEPSFAALAEGIVKDIRARPVLDDLLDRGLVTRAENGILRLEARSVVPLGDDPALLDLFSANLHDHLEASCANIDHADPLHFERAVFYEGVPRAVIDALEREVRQDGVRLLERVNAMTLARSEEAPADAERGRYRLGIYFYREDEGGDAT